MTRCARPCLLFAILLATTSPAAAQSSLTLAWDPNPEPDVTGYVLSWGLKYGEFTASVNVGNVTQWTVSGLNPDQRYYFSVQARNSAGQLSARSSIVSNDRVISGLANGSLRDDRPGIFWQHDTDGRLLTWHLFGFEVVETRQLSIPAADDVNWRIQGTGDFNRDGFTDVLWRHQTNGGLALWYLHNNTVIGTTMLSIPVVADLNWRLRGAGDVNQDGYADIVWQHSSGRVAVWLMQNETVLTTRVLNYATSGAWEIGAVADVDGDSCADLIWQNASDGRLAVWTLQGATVTLTKLLSITRINDPNWRIQGAGDIDGSGRPALIWRHVVDGSVAVWYLNGTLVTGTYVTIPGRVDDLHWMIVGGR